MADDWRAGHALLTKRAQEIPTAVHRTATRALPPLALGSAPVRRVVATGVGSSAAHATLLAYGLSAAGGDATTVPLSTFFRPPRPARDEVLVVFSQGLSPNAQLALADPASWRRIVLVTAVTEARRLDPLRAVGIAIHTIDGEHEFGTLVRLIGPLTGYVAALQLIEALGGAPAPSPAALVDACTARPDPPCDLTARPLAFVASETYGGLLQNLQYKLLEGLFTPLPPVWDVLHFAHGPYQQHAQQPATFIALTRPDAAGEAAALDRMASMLDPALHELVRVPARAAAPLALLEHETWLNGVLLDAIAARGIDQQRWPGHGADAPLYTLAHRPREPRLANLAWPELDAAPARVAIIPLGATEQHGPHLPFITDTVIANALAMRLAAHVDAAVALPALPIGCSSEHRGFPGTLDLRPETLRTILEDLLRSLAQHGIDDVFIFSAHGGNVATLRALAPQLAAGHPRRRLQVAADLDGVTAALHGVARSFGVTAEAAGHHAGEVETSIMLALDPSMVRHGALAPGYVEPTTDPQALFYPNLRQHAPNGTVGDPRGATAVRGERYLAAWTEALVASLGPLAKNRA